jgi:hypothetical protein
VADRSNAASTLGRPGDYFLGLSGIRTIAIPIVKEADIVTTLKRAKRIPSSGAPTLRRARSTRPDRSALKPFDHVKTRA